LKELRLASFGGEVITVQISSFQVVMSVNWLKVAFSLT